MPDPVKRFLRMVRHRTVLIVALALVAVGLELGGLVAVRHVLDRRHQVSRIGLLAAMQTFRPVEHPGLSQPVAAADLGRDKSARSVPARCTPLSLLATDSAVDGGSWTGADGRPLQPVSVLAIRFADAGQARRQLRLKRSALLTCTRMALTFPPFEQPAQTFDVRARTWPPELWWPDRMAYALVSGGRRYEFYVRRFDNVVIWSYGDPEGVALRRDIVDDLADRLSELPPG